MPRQVINAAEAVGSQRLISGPSLGSRGEQPARINRDHAYGNQNNGQADD